MPRPDAYYPSSVPLLQLIAEDLDLDVLAIRGPLEPLDDIELTAGYAASGAFTYTQAGAFADWPAFGLFENLTTNELVMFSRTTDDAIEVVSAGRGRNSTTPAAGIAGHEIRFIERRILGRLLNQICAELSAMSGGVVDLLNANTVLNAAAYGKTYATDAFTANRQVTLPEGVENGLVGFVMGNTFRLTLVAAAGDSISVEGSAVATVYSEEEDAVIWLRFCKGRWVYDRQPGGGWITT